MGLRAQRHVSPDGSLVLVCEHLNDDDWVIGLEGSGWHTHPNVLALEGDPVAAVEGFIERVLSDRAVVVISEYNGARESLVVDAETDPSLESGLSIDSLAEGVLAEHATHGRRGETLVCRVWSGMVLGRLP